MATLGFAEAFGKYGAKLKNVNWSVCAETPDGSLVASLWSHHFSKPEKGLLLCQSNTMRWGGPGRNEFAEALRKAFETKQPVRVVIATTPTPDIVESGADASKLDKTFTVRPDLVGRVTKFDGVNYVIEFRKENREF